MKPLLKKIFTLYSMTALLGAGQAHAAIFPQVQVLEKDKAPIATNIRQIRGNIDVSYTKSKQVFGNYLFQQGNIQIKHRKKTFNNKLLGPGAITFKTGSILWLSTVQSAQKTSVEVIKFNTKLQRKNNFSAWVLKTAQRQADLWRLYGPGLQKIVIQNNVLGNKLNYYTSTIDFEEITCRKRSGQSAIKCQLPFIINIPVTQNIGATIGENETSPAAIPYKKSGV